MFKYIINYTFLNSLFVVFESYNCIGLFTFIFIYREFRVVCSLNQYIGICQLFLKGQLHPNCLHYVGEKRDTKARMKSM